MRSLNSNDFRTFEKLCSLSQKGVQKTLSTYIHSKYKNHRIWETKEYIVAEGDIPVALVAHMDTVFAQPAREVFYDRTKGVIWSPQGLGADDRAGVFGIIQIIKSGLRPHIILTTDEEVGAAGAIALTTDFPEHPFTQLQYIIELDRRGADDCVFYDCDNPDFIDYIENFGFVFNYGSFSDISIIGEDWGVAAVNLSIGYRDEHSVSEILNVGQMLNTISKVCKMLNEKDIPYFKFIPSPGYNKSYNNWWRYAFTGGPTENYTFDDDSAAALEGYNRNHCWVCDAKQDNTSMIPVKMIDGQTHFFCIDCIVNNVKWCHRCGEAYEPIEGATMELCNDCRKEVLGRSNSPIL